MSENIKIVELLVKAYTFNEKAPDTMGTYWDVAFEEEVKRELEKVTGVCIEDLEEMYKDK